MYPQPYLQKYKGNSTRHTCPSCGRKHSFTLYLNGQTHEPINWKVGKCNREIKCGYHYPPRQYFIDNQSSLTPPFRGGWVGLHTSSNTPNRTNHRKLLAPSTLERAGERLGTIPFHYLKNSLSANSNFISFLQNYFTEEQINTVFEKYLLGATRKKEVIFWQIDIQGRIRTGKIMQYNPETGKRLKHESGSIDWVHNKLKKSKLLTEDFNLQQCFFGEHLLKDYPDKYIGIVESEKSAIISSCIVPDIIWLAAGSLNGLSIEKCRVLKGREIILYPDLGAYEKWTSKAEEIRKNVSCKITISNLLENKATDIERTNGLDVVDYIIFEYNYGNNINIK